MSRQVPPLLCQLLPFYSMASSISTGGLQQPAQRGAQSLKFAHINTSNIVRKYVIKFAQPRAAKLTFLQAHVKRKQGMPKQRPLFVNNQPSFFQYKNMQNFSMTSLPTVSLSLSPPFSFLYSQTLFYTLSLSVETTPAQSVVDINGKNQCAGPGNQFEGLLVFRRER